MQAALPSATAAAAPPRLLRPPIPAIVQQHADDAAHLRHLRSVLVRAPHVKLLQLQRLDDRLEAHLDGLAVAGAYGLARAQEALERPGCGEVFAALVCALQLPDEPAVDRLLSLAPVLPEAWRGAVSALGWVSPAQLRERVRGLLASPQPWRQALGIEACRLHRVDPGPALAAALQQDDALRRDAALRAAGELGRVDLLPGALALLDFAPEAARAACLLGDRASALRAIEQAAFATPAAHPLRSLAVQALDWPQARDAVRALAHDPRAVRQLVRGIGWLGDVRLVPWLIERMGELPLARLAGEAFSFITGADLAALDLERKPPEDFQSGPTDNPEDEDVAMDEDDSLPWPDADRVQRWWQAEAARFPVAQRAFVGGPVTPAHCLQVLQVGTQRQRALAAQQLALLQPGRPLFPVAAPVWRQRRLLGRPAR